ncbi:MAG: YlbF family regulator [Planctomycetota bacterium]|nr:YlbF family regulator [Planctomycetota bacterium]
MDDSVEQTVKFSTEQKAKSTIPSGGNFDEILSLARQLGEAISRHPRYAKLREADERVRGDKSATDALDAYNKAAEELSRKERSGRPIEVEDKRRLRSLQETVAANEAVKAFMVSQADYAELMRKMNDAIYQAISGEQEPAGPQG